MVYGCWWRSSWRFHAHFGERVEVLLVDNAVIVHIRAGSFRNILTGNAKPDPRDIGAAQDPLAVDVAKDRRRRDLAKLVCTKVGVRASRCRAGRSGEVNSDAHVLACSLGRGVSSDAEIACIAVGKVRGLTDDFLAAERGAD